MFEKEIRELFELAWRVMNETDYFVSFEIAAHTHCCYIGVMNSKWEPDKERDATYDIYIDRGTLKEVSFERYKLAKAHLLKFLVDGKCPLGAEYEETPAEEVSE